MDRIAAIRNIEDALAAYEAGETDLATVEERTLSALRTYATEFDGERRAYRAVGDERGGRRRAVHWFGVGHTPAERRVG